MIYNDFQQAKAAAAQAAKETGKAAKLKRQDGGWLVEIPGHPRTADSPKHEVELNWDTGSTRVLDEEVVPF